MKLKSLFTAVVLLACSAVAASAESITSFTDSLTAASSTQMGRISRQTNGTFQTWAGFEGYTYPGVVNPGTTYYYKTYTYAAALFAGAPYVDISFFDENNSAQTFISAWANGYNLLSGTGWLGDAGNSGNLFGTDARTFDVILPTNADLVLVVNTTPGGTTGLNQPYDIAVNAFADTDLDDPVVAPVPEPSSLLLVATGALGAVGALRRRFAL